MRAQSRRAVEARSLRDRSALRMTVARRPPIVARYVAVIASIRPKSIADPFDVVVDDTLQVIAIPVDHRPAQFLRQQPGALVTDAELILQFPSRHAFGMRRHEMRRPEPRRQRQLGTMLHRSRRGRSLMTAIEAFVCVCPALRRRGALLATAGTNKTLPSTPLQQKVSATRPVAAASNSAQLRRHTTSRRTLTARRVSLAAWEIAGGNAVSSRRGCQKRKKRSPSFAGNRRATDSANQSRLVGDSLLGKFLSR